MDGFGKANGSSRIPWGKRFRRAAMFMRRDLSGAPVRVVQAMGRVATSLDRDQGSPAREDLALVLLFMTERRIHERRKRAMSAKRTIAGSEKPVFDTEPRSPGRAVSEILKAPPLDLPGSTAFSRKIEDEDEDRTRRRRRGLSSQRSAAKILQVPDSEVRTDLYGRRILKGDKRQ